MKDILKEYEALIKPNMEYEEMMETSLKFVNQNLRTFPMELQALIDTLLALVEKKGDDKSKAILYLSKGWTQIDSGNYQKAQENFLESKNIFASTDDKRGMSRAYNSLGYCATITGDMVEALKYYDLALELSLPIDDFHGLSIIYGNMGETFQRFGELEEAIKYYEKGLANNPDIANRAVILEGLGCTYHRLGDLERALPYLLEALDIVNTHSFVLIKSHLLATLGAVYEDMNHYEKAIEVLQEAKKLSRIANLPKFEGDAYLALGRISLRREETTKALAYFKKAFKISQEINEVSLKAYSAKNISDICREMGNWRGAYDYFAEFYSEMQKLANEKTAKEMQRLKLKEANREIELLKQMYQQVSMISQMGKEITSSLNLEEIMFTIYETLNELMDTTMFGVGLYDERNKEIIIHFAVENSKWRQPASLSLDRKDSFAVRSFTNNEEIIINDAYVEYEKYIDKITSANPEREDKIQSLIYLPLEVNNKLIGIITVQSDKKNAYDEYKVEMIKALASYIAIAVENSNLYEKVQRMATRDTVTNLYNRTHFIHLAQKEFAKFKRSGRGFTIIMFDLDLFKNINDQYGHDVGDLALKHIAKTCQRRLRDSDLFSRYGGDEFIILLPITELASGKIVANNLKDMLNKTALVLEDGRSFKVTASFGLAQVMGEDITLKDVLKKADIALYQAKNAGRNQVALYKKSFKGLS